jgi:hypothetical protein
MQYILSEEEMEEVRNLRAEMKSLPSVEKLQKMCTKIADEWPSFHGWDGKSDPEPWGCVLSVEYEHYCDECPVQTICPKERKSWSK